MVLALVGIASWLSVATVQSAGCSADGSVTRDTYFGDDSARPRYFTLYLPPCYASSNQLYPLLILLHGSNADDSQWVRLGFIDEVEAAIQTGASPPMIVALPFGDSISNENHFGGQGYDSILLGYLDHLQQRYRSDGRTAIGGISRGGFWAYHLGLRFPDRFLAIGGHSPFFDPLHVEPAYNPLDLARSIELESDTRLWLDRGTRDFAADGVDQIHVILQDRDIDHHYVVYSGAEHNQASWKRNISDYLGFYSAAFASFPPANTPAKRTSESGRELWVPAAAFAALQTSIGRDQLDAILKGGFDQRLIMSESALNRLREHGFELHSDTRIVKDENLEGRLWRDKLYFTLLPFDELQPRLRPLWLDGQPVVDQTGDYPLIFDYGAPNFYADSLTRITLSGTTAIARQTRTAMDAIGIEAAASGIRGYASAADFFHVTNEASFSDACPQHNDTVLGGANSLCMKREHADLFDVLNTDVVELTGNHINDFGYDAFENTLHHFEVTGIKVVGGGRNLDDARKPLILSHNGNRVAWLACNAIGPYYALVNEDPGALGGVRPGAAFCDRVWLGDTLPVLAAENDLLLLTVQYQEFESYTPTKQQQADFRTFAEWGADVVIGTAEHKPMTFEFYDTRRGETSFIHYGLGNLYFDQTFWGNMRFFLDTLYVYDSKLLAVELFPGIIDGQAHPRLLEGDDQFNFLHFVMIQQNGF